MFTAHVPQIFSAQDLSTKESQVLQAYAVHSCMSRGRRHAEPPDQGRLPFQKDRDRIIHSRAFRRLKAKTQVFVAHYGDHYRTRLAHSLEVAQVSRDLARMLGLNEDLAESIALAHDLGHTPFGHAGEEALNAALQVHGLHFEHNEQSRRIVEELEEIYPEWNGLNLSIEVIEGLMKHQTSWDNPTGAESISPSLEAQIVNLGDEIAYQNHDVDDGLRSGLFLEKDLDDLRLWKLASALARQRYGNLHDERVRWSRTVSALVSIMIENTATESVRRLREHQVDHLDRVYALGKHGVKLIGFSMEMESMNQELRDFLTTRLYFHPTVLALSQRGQEVIQQVFDQALQSGMPPEKVRDFVAGMTDQFALERGLEWSGSPQ